MTIIIAAAIWAILLLAVGGLLTEIGPWYRQLRKSPWQPPDWLFGPAWTILLGLAAWALVLAWNGADSDAERRDVAILFGVNFVAHLVWSPLFFKLKRPDWALIEMPFLWFSLIAMLFVLPRTSELASWLIVPYFIWVSFAACLNYEVVRRNKPFGTGAAGRV